ncbi:MAG: pilin [Candidatus Buchananbacteria bacterium]
MNNSKKLFSSRKIKATIFCFGLVVLFLMLTPPVLALDTGLSYGTATGLSTQDIRITIMKIIRIFLGLVGFITIILIIYAGYTWMTSAGNAEKIDQAKRILRNAVIGLLIIFSAFSIVSFIIGVLQGNLGPSGPGGGTQVPPGCENCDHLGTGIIQSVYPLPLAKDVARNTRIMVTFKVKMKPDTIINGAAENCTAAAPCTGALNINNVKIYPYVYKLAESEIDNTKLQNVTATSADGLTFTFQPRDYLGDGLANIWYAVKLGNGIRKDNNETAFSGTNNYFMWRFEVGSRLDLDPAEVTGVFPQPDNLGDNYSEVLGTAMVAKITMTGRPSTASSATVSSVRTAPTYACSDGADNNGNGQIDMADSACSATNLDGESPTAMPRLVVNGSYNGTYQGKVTLLLNTGATKTTATATWLPIRDGSPASYTITNNTLTLGDGISLSFVSPSTGADQWEVTLTPYSQPDGLRVANKIYTFGTDITVGATSAATAANIRAKLAADTLNPALTISGSSSEIILTSSILGRTGNFTIETRPANSTWASIVTTQQGEDSVLNSTPRDVPDKPRNAIVTLNFNEPIDPVAVQIPGVLKVQYNSNSDPSQTPSWVDVAGKFLVSNQYQTVEFIPEGQCKVCYGGTSSGNACNSGSDCPSGSCESVKNSCGDRVYCLPTLADGNTVNTAPNDATRYRVLVKAGKLRTCDEGANRCTDPNFSVCANTSAAGTSQACQGTFGTAPSQVLAFYPTAANPPAGLIDAANNSLNGNNNVYTNATGGIFGKAEGPGYFDLNTEPDNQSGKPAYSLNKVCSGNHSAYCSINSDCAAGTCVNLPDDQGDNLIWYFYVNTNLNLTPAHLLSVGPNIGATGVSLTLPVEGTYDELLMSSTLKAGSNYRDGFCFCTANGDCDTNAGETCQSGKCKNETNQNYCEKNNECETNRCLNKKYMTLINPSTFQVGWWIGKKDIDTLPLDGFGDQSQALLYHTKLSEVTDYGIELGSGIKDIYQNCYLPSEGPKTATGYTHCSVTADIECTTDIDCPTGEHCSNFCDLTTNPSSCCQVSQTEPYCCNGSKSAIPCRHCQTTTSISCDSKDDCPGNEQCIY